jgi:serine/threonine protein kinase
MNTDRWNLLSGWHNDWLAASADRRSALRSALASEHPELLEVADELVAHSEDVDGFLETPALALAARELAEDAPLFDPGAMVGPYLIVELLARGGMGDVYRATDPRLGRDVALKTLSHASRSDAGAVQRFLQEARLTASLDHQNIVRLFDVGVSNGRPYLVSELLDGETLKAVIGRGPVAASHARAIASAIASGLASAHERGLVHRDLKPENVFITRSGTVKILDFGIAKLAQDTGMPKGVATLTGVVLGTAGYLAPEQVTGDAVDARADLFALGSILFELLTGTRAFARDHTIDTLHAIVHDDPPDVLPPADPMTAVVKRLLAKAPEARFQSAIDLMWVLDRLGPVSAATESTTAPAATPRRRLGPSKGWVIAGTASLALVTTFAAGRLIERAATGANPPALTRFSWSLPAGTQLDSAPIVSPDGRRIAFTAYKKGPPQLFVRSLDSLDATAIAGTEGARHPFWSPDSASLGFFARSKLLTVTVAGGVPKELAPALDARGGAWSPTGTIVFSADQIFSGLSQVPANGGPVEPATLLDAKRGENSHRWPAFLPDGVHFLFHVRATADDRRGVYIGRIDRPATEPGEPLFRSESEAVFVATSGQDRGVLLSAVDGHLQARPFDARTLSLTGEPQAVRVPAGTSTPHHSAMVSVSPDLLAAVGASVPYGVTIGTIMRDGSGVRRSPRHLQGSPRLSPDGRRLAKQIVDPIRGNPDLWVENVDDGSLVRVTTSPQVDLGPVWSPDGRRLAYGSGTPGERRLSIAAADGTGVLRDMACPASYCEPTDWSPDGRHLLVNTRAEMGTPPGDVWRLPVDGNSAPEAILSGEFPEYDARLSPDGQWLAYVSQESGRPEVSLRAMSGSPRRLVASTGGSQPVWQRDGRELLFVDLEGRLWGRSVRRQSNGEIALGAAERLPVPLIGLGHFGTQYDVSPDGRLVYFMDRGPAPGPTDISLLLGWRALLK